MFTENGMWNNILQDVGFFLYQETFPISLKSNAFAYASRQGLIFQ